MGCDMGGPTDDPQLFSADDVLFIPLTSPDPPPPSSPEAANDNRQPASCGPDTYAALPVELRFAALCLSPPWPDPARTKYLSPPPVEEDDVIPWREKIGGRPRVDRTARAKLCDELEAALEPLWRAKMVGAAKSYKPPQHEGVGLVRELLKDRKEDLPVKEIEGIARRVQPRVLQKR
jgi:hypothetical protein